MNEETERPYEDRDAQEVQREHHYQRLGTRSPKCSCGETHPAALTGTYPNIQCYECSRIAQGLNPIEQHHLIGRHNDPMLVAPLPGNPHRILSEMQNESWPQQTLRNPDASPLLKAAAAIRSFLDFLRMLLDHVLGWVPQLLEKADEALRERLGPQYWIALGLQGGMS